MQAENRVRCGDSLYDPLAVYWKWEDQRHHTYPRNRLAVRMDVCDPEACVGCLSVKRCTPVAYRWWYEWCEAWRRIGDEYKKYCDGLAERREQDRVNSIFRNFGRIAWRKDTQKFGVKHVERGSNHQSGYFVDGFEIYFDEWRYDVSITLPSEDPVRRGFIWDGATGGGLGGYGLSPLQSWGWVGRPGKEIFVASHKGVETGFWDEAFRVLQVRLAEITAAMMQEDEAEKAAKAAEEQRAVARWLAGKRDNLPGMNERHS